MNFDGINFDQGQVVKDLIVDNAIRGGVILSVVVVVQSVMQRLGKIPDIVGIEG